MPVRAGPAGGLGRQQAGSDLTRARLGGELVFVDEARGVQKLGWGRGAEGGRGASAAPSVGGCLCWFRRCTSSCAGCWSYSCSSVAVSRAKGLEILVPARVVDSSPGLPSTTGLGQRIKVALCGGCVHGWVGFSRCCAGGLSRAWSRSGSPPLLPRCGAGAKRRTARKRRETLWLERRSSSATSRRRKSRMRSSLSRWCSASPMGAAGRSSRMRTWTMRW